MGETDPQVSVLMVARNAAPFIGAAIASARRQTFQDLEVVVIDDNSTDDTRTIAQRHASEDARVRVLAGPGAGLAAVRNASLAAARGRYGVILDSDDLLHPRHVETLLAAAKDAQIAVTNMIEFGMGDGVRTVRPFLAGSAWSASRPISAEDFAYHNRVGGRVVLGYLKPLFDLAFLRTHALVYDPALRIGEDFDLVFRALLSGARMAYLPAQTYFYRRHADSTSARTPPEDLAALLDSDLRYRLPGDYRLLHARASRRKALAASLRATHATTALKNANLPAALRALWLDPLAWRFLGRALGEAIAKRMRRLQRMRGEHGAPRPVALVFGTQPESGPLAERLSALTSEGWHLEERPLEAAHSAPFLLANAVAEPEALVLVTPQAHELVPFALAPHARVIGPDGRDCPPDIIP